MKIKPTGFIYIPFFDKSGKPTGGIHAVSELEDIYLKIFLDAFNERFPKDKYPDRFISHHDYFLFSNVFPLHEKSS